MNFERPNPLALNMPLPDAGPPGTGIYPFWDDLLVDASASVRTGTAGTSPNRTFSIEWRNVALRDDPTQRITFAVTLAETGQVTFAYGQLNGGDLAHGGSASVGIEDSSGALGIGYLANQPILHSNSAIRFTGVGLVQGVVTTKSGDPLANSKVDLGNGTYVWTDIAGYYRIPMSTGAHTLYYTHTDYTQESRDVTIAHDGDVINQDVVLKPLHNKLVGYVRDDLGRPLVGKPVSLLTIAWPYTAITGPDGGYHFDDLPANTYTATINDLCLTSPNQQLVVDSDMTVNFVLPLQHDAFGNRCNAVPMETFAPLTVLALTGDDADLQVALPFAFPYYGQTFTSVDVNANGVVSFVGAGRAISTNDWMNLPNSTSPRGAVFAWWDDLIVDGSASVRAQTYGSGASARFVIEWHNVAVKSDTTQRVTVQVVLYPDGRVHTQYPSLPLIGGHFSYVAYSNPSNSAAFVIAANNYWPLEGRAIEFLPPQ